MPTVRLPDFEMFFESRGAGEPLLLLHGGMGIGADWRYVFSSDPDGYRLVVPDLRGHGRSTNPAGTFTFRQCGSDVLALLDHLNLPAIDAIGLSMGAKTLLHVATKQPDRVKAMVLVSATPRFSPSAKAAMAQYGPKAFETLSSEALAMLRSRHVHGDTQIRQLYAMTAGFASRDDDMAFTSSLLGHIRARTLIVHGDRDPLYPLELALEPYRGIPSAELWVVPGAGHGPIFGDLAPPFVTQAITFLRSNRTANAP